jgi:hypothetical protein
MCTWPLQVHDFGLVCSVTAPVDLSTTTTQSTYDEGAGHPQALNTRPVQGTVKFASPRKSLIALFCLTHCKSSCNECPMFSDRWLHMSLLELEFLDFILLKMSVVSVRVATDGTLIVQVKGPLHVVCMSRHPISFFRGESDTYTSPKEPIQSPTRRNREKHTNSISKRLRTLPLPHKILHTLIRALYT